MCTLERRSSTMIWERPEILHRENSAIIENKHDYGDR